MKAFEFHDLLEPGPAVRVLARVHLFGTNEGGRITPVSGVYRPDHNFGAPNGRQFYIGQVELPSGLELLPGETQDLYITFLNGPNLSKNLYVGRSWRIQEGAHFVATGEILAVLGEP